MPRNVYPQFPSRTYVDSFLRAALAEDVGAGDVTTRAVAGRKRVPATGVCLAKEPCVVAGLPVALRAFELLDRRVKATGKMKEGARAKKGKALFRVRGPAQALLGAERVALNVLSRLCGVATLTRAFVDRTKGTRAVVLDTRKTTPLMRSLEKYAVRAGGGANHRFGLGDAVLIKENHVVLAGGVKEALRRASRVETPVEIEVRNLKELGAALRAGAAWILLDNFSLPQLRKAVALARGRAVLEASGGVTLRNVRSIARTGVDFISVGALTHSAPAANLSFVLEERR
ncbi:MAG: carboxylating nicotinate-nucleotide diphosphorylase [Acidobacteriota bacterium]|nr:MAG: carboxylating nicotinate-nucleotide diphosphorylase [Acidobacteriota bacterium]